jgi:MFS family permease
VAHEPQGKQQSKEAGASGWIGSALEYYDFFIYATAAALLFPQLFFPQNNPRIAIVASLGSFAVGYIARPIGAIVLGHWGDTHGRKAVLIFSMLLMGISTMVVGVLPTYQQIGLWAPVLLVTMRLIQGFAVAGDFSGSSSMILEHAPFGRRGYFASFTLQGAQAGQLLAAAAFLPLAQFMPKDQFLSWGWRIPFLLSFVVIIAGYIIRRKVNETPAFTKEVAHGGIPAAPVLEALRLSKGAILRVIGMSLNAVIVMVATTFGAAYAVQPAYGIGFPSTIYLWIPVMGNLLAVILIPFLGDLSDRIGRRPLMIFGTLTPGLLSFAYLYAISIRNIWLTVFLSLLMWGIAYQPWQAVFPSFFAEQFRTRVRVSGMAVGQNVGTTLSAFLPVIFVSIAPPGAGHIPLKIGAVTLGLCVITAIAAFMSPETYRTHLEDLGDPKAVPVPKSDYDRVHADRIAAAAQDA